MILVVYFTCKFICCFFVAREILHQFWHLMGLIKHGHDSRSVKMLHQRYGHQIKAGVSNTRPTTAFCADHDAFWGFSND